MAHAVADIFRQAAELNESDPTRKGSTVHLGDQLEIIATGDMHGEAQALAKIIAYADLPGHPGRRLILQEIIHGPIEPQSGCDRSVELLLRTAKLKIAQGDKVIFLMGNHDLAQATGNEITKAGLGVCKAFCEGVEFCFGECAAEVLEAVKEFCLSLPLAVRCANGVLITHSLPSPERMDLAGVEILERAYKGEDLSRGGAVYEWVWGRDQTDQQTDALAEQLGVEFFVLGHRRIETAYEMLTSRAATVASDHRHGCVLHFSTDSSLTAETLPAYIKPIASLAKDS